MAKPSGEVDELLQQPRERLRAAERQMQAIGLEPARVPGAVVDPVEHLDALWVALAGVPDHLRVVRLTAAELARRDQAELALRAENLLGLVDLPARHGGVGTKREDHEVRELMGPASAAEDAQALGELPATAGVGLVAHPGERRQSEEHRGVADGQRRTGRDLVLRGG